MQHYVTRTPSVTCTCERKCYLRSLMGLQAVSPDYIPGPPSTGAGAGRTAVQDPELAWYRQPRWKRGQHPTRMGRKCLGLLSLSGPDSPRISHTKASIKSPLESLLLHPSMTLSVLCWDQEDGECWWEPGEESKLCRLIKTVWCEPSTHHSQRFGQI